MILRPPSSIEKLNQQEEKHKDTQHKQTTHNMKRELAMKLKWSEVGAVSAVYSALKQNILSRSDVGLVIDCEQSMRVMLQCVVQ